MPISDKTRKILWTRSGNRCALCKCELVVDATITNSESVVGDECHIISRQLNGPRHDPNYPEDKLDSYENLIVLCRVHHKMVDDQCETYNVNILSRMKSNHENWVSQTLSDKPEFEPIRFRRVKENIPCMLIRLRSGLDVLAVIENCGAGSFEHEELESKEEVEVVGQFFDQARDWGDMCIDSEPSDRVRVAYELANSLADLEGLGLLVYGGREVQVLEDGTGKSADWPVSSLCVVRQDSKSRITLDTNEAIEKENA